MNEHYQDPTTDETAWVVVDVAFLEKFKKEIPLGEVKNHPKLANMELLRQSRLSVQKVTQEESDYIILLANGK